MKVIFPFGEVCFVICSVRQNYMTRKTLQFSFGERNKKLGKILQVVL